MNQTKIFLLSLMMLIAVAERAAAYDEVLLTEQNSIPLFFELNPIQLADFAYHIEKHPEIEYIVVYSPGGMIAGIEEFANTISSFKHVKYLIINASSAAAAITQLATNEILIVPNGKMMFHRLQARFSTFKEFTEWKRDISLLERDDHKFADQCRRRLCVSRAKYDFLTIQKQWSLTAAEALKVCAVDRIVKAKCDLFLEAKAKMMCKILNF